MAGFTPAPGAPFKIATPFAVESVPNPPGMLGPGVQQDNNLLIFANPWQYTFCGGAQPFAPQSSAPQGVPVNNPPFGRPTQQANLQAIQAWQPSIYGNLFSQQATQGLQVDQPPSSMGLLCDFYNTLQTWVTPDPLPQRPVQIAAVIPPPVVVTFVASTDVPMQPVWTWWGAQPDPVPRIPLYQPVPPPPNPPFYGSDYLGNLESVLVSWLPPDPRPIVNSNLNPVFEAVRVDNPPPYAGAIDDFYNILIDWLPPDPAPITGPKLVWPVRVDNPPFGMPPAWLTGVMGAWVPPPAQAPVNSNLNPVFEAVRVDQPPPYSTVNLYDVLVAWIPPPPAPIVGPKLVWPVKVDSPPPYSHVSEDAILEAWIPPPPQPILNGNLNPFYEAVRVDQPPPYSHVDLDLLIDWIPPPPQPIVGQQLNPVFEAVRVDNPPFGIPPKWLDIVLAAWIPPPPAPVLNGNINASFLVIPAPPPYSHAIIDGILESWIPGPPAPITGPKLVWPVRVDNPPPCSHAINDEILAAWIPPPPQAPVGPTLNAVFENVLITIPPQFSQAVLFDVILPAWIPPPPQAPLPDLLPPVSLGVRVDNPPLASHKIDVELVSWLPPDPRPYFPQYLVQPFVQFQPTRQGQVDTVKIAWIPPDPAPVLARNNYPSLLSVPVNNPPPSSLVNVEDILAAWIPPPPAPIVNGNLNPSLEAVRVDQPPLTIGSLGDLHTVLETWLPPDQPLQAARYAPQAAIPVLGGYPWLPGVLASWQAPDAPPQRAPRVTAAARADNPPFGMPPPWMKAVLAAWIPPPPAPILRAMVRTQLAALLRQLLADTLYYQPISTLRYQAVWGLDYQSVHPLYYQQITALQYADGVQLLFYPAR